MSEVNIREPESITGKTYLCKDISGYDHSNPLTLLTNSYTSPVVYRINSIIVSPTMFDSAEVSVVVDGEIFGSSNGITTSYLAKEVDIPSGSTQIISTKETYFYLEKDFRIRAARTAGNNNAASITISYEIIF